MKQANLTAENLRNVSDYLAAAQEIEVDSIVLQPDIQSHIDDIQNKINSSATTLSNKTMENSQNIQEGLDGM